ncbi:MAG: hypothetical protein A2498_06745 [Lentisphaerae bacterium RIFOXYC12_FULL_60_16]|nr:MAG: hypothetical protein A2498_06745 [Lentisphaerae bacterium RIFOXYC12_FULL_60_16]
MIRIALLGAGAHSRTAHALPLQHYAKLHPGRITLSAVCDLDHARADACARKYGFEHACTSLQDLMCHPIGPPDALVAILPIPAMLRVTPELFRLGIPLLIEKPLGNNLAEARQLLDEARRTGAMDRTMVSFNRRFDPALRLALEWLRTQEPPRLVHGAMLRAERTEPDFPWGTGLHLIDALSFAIGSLALSTPAICPHPGHDNWRQAVFQGRNRTRVTLELAPTAGEWEEHIRFLGNGYQVDVHTGTLPPGRVRIVHSMREVLLHRSPDNEPGFITSGAYAENAGFIEAVIARRPFETATLADALASSELAAAIQDRT